MNLYDYQEDIIYNTSFEIAEGRKNVIVQLATGGGKTVIFSSIVDRFWNKRQKRVLILVHRYELLRQTIDTLWKWYGIDAQAITADTKGVYDRKCYVAMVETANRRLNSSKTFFPPLGMVICDERHLGNFNKIHQHFSHCINIGFSATPLASNRKNPLNKYYESIICGPQINELIQLGALVQNHTFSPVSVNRSKLKIVAGKFDEKFMGDEFSKIRNVTNTIKNYESICPNSKAICYNCNIEHSIIMHKAWLSAGYKSMHIDDTTPKDERKRIFRWFEETDEAIMNNVGIATMGYDNPSIQTVIENRATTSPVLSIQMGGRGGRPFPGKDYFTILDMGGNHRDISQGGHGDWNSDRDWTKTFFYPPKHKEKLDAQPVKNCPNCMAIMSIQASICPICGFELPKAPVVYDSKEIKLELVTKNINVEELIKKNEHLKPYYTLCQIGYKIATYSKYKCGGNITKEIDEQIFEAYEEKAKEWCKLKSVEYNGKVKWIMKDVLKRSLYPANKENITNVKSIKGIQPINGF